MFRPRIIPVLLLKKNVLVKSQQFNNHRYIGDPINAVKIFNDIKADELVFLDILATKENRLIPIDIVKKVAEEANMPFAVGGGIKSLEDIRLILKSGAEKVIINTSALEHPDFIKNASETFGSSSIVICIDIKKKFLRGSGVCIRSGRKFFNYSPVDFARCMEEKGAGEIIVQSIDNDGMMNGYNIELLKSISRSITIPVIGLGGAGNLEHMKRAYTEGSVNGLAAGSMFVFHGPHKSVLINYPDKKEIKMYF